MAAGRFIRLCMIYSELPLGKKPVPGETGRSDQAKVSITRSIAGCLRFYTFTQCLDRPA
jgi:hypothetical protein